MSQKLLIAADHAGFPLKEAIKVALQKRGLSIQDLGTYATDSVDYPDFAHQLAHAIVKDPEALGILICGSGIGMSIAANRHKGLRAALVHNSEFAKLAKQHNNANVICLAGRNLSERQAMEIVGAWLNATFEGGRHEKRIHKLENC